VKHALSWLLDDTEPCPGSAMARTRFRVHCAYGLHELGMKNSHGAYALAVQGLLANRICTRSNEGSRHSAQVLPLRCPPTDLSRGHKAETIQMLIYKINEQTPLGLAFIHATALAFCRLGEHKNSHLNILLVNPQFMPRIFTLRKSLLRKYLLRY